MAKDFAHIEAVQEPIASPWSLWKTMLLTTTAIAIVLGAFVGGFWMGHEQGIQVAFSEDKARLEKRLNDQTEQLKNLRAAAKKHVDTNVSTTQVGELTFYNELPKQAVQPAPLSAGEDAINHSPRALDTNKPSSSQAAIREMIAKELQQTLNHENDIQVVKGKGNQSPANSKTKSLNATSSFSLQIASFQKEIDANAFLPKLKRHGFKPVIRRVELAKLGVWYRVFLIDYSSREAAEKARTSVKASLNITGLIIKDD